LRAISLKQKIPYRESKLTLALRNSLVGSCNLSMIVNILADQIDESISSLTFS